MLLVLWNEMSCERGYLRHDLQGRDHIVDPRHTGGKDICSAGLEAGSHTRGLHEVPVMAEGGVGGDPEHTGLPQDFQKKQRK